MCKDCQYWIDAKDANGNPTITKELLFSDLEKHKLQHGMSGYGGAAWWFNKCLDDKETIDVIVRCAKKKGWEDVVELGLVYRLELFEKLQSFLL